MSGRGEKAKGAAASEPAFLAMLAAHDEAALAALTSKGAARRAQRDAEAGKARLIERSEGAARLEVDGETLSIDAAGPRAARCTCPASGVCRHIAAAVLSLRASLGAPAEAEPPSPAPSGSKSAAQSEDAAAAASRKKNARKTAKPTPAPPDAHSEILGLTLGAIEVFAGADWADAIALARLGGTATRDGLSLAVTLDGPQGRVVFIAGAGLKGAVFKGAKSRTRKAVAAAALIARAEAGLAAPATPDSAAAGLDPAYLSALEPLLAEAAAATLTGVAELGRDALFDAAVSARAEAAPRLAGALRGLSNQAALAEADDIAFEPDGFLRASARAAALIAALRAAPDDVALTGALRRDYAEAAPIDLAILGAAPWTTLAGARGLRIYALTVAPPEADPRAESPIAPGRWLRTGPSRAAGADPSFTPQHAYGAALWGAASAQRAMGRTLHLPAPRVSSDGQIAGASPAPARLLDEDEATAEAARAAVEASAHALWGIAKVDLANRFGEGLRRAVAPEPLLLAPSALEAPVFDEIGQRFVLRAVDGVGAELELSMPLERESAAHRLCAMAGRLAGLLVEATLAGDRLALTPVSAIAAGEGRLEIWNLALDPPPTRRRLPALFAEARRRVAQAVAAPPPPLAAADPLARLAGDALEVAVEVMRGRPPERAEARIAALESAGFAALAQALAGAAAAPSRAAALRLAYLAGEAQIACALT